MLLHLDSVFHESINTFAAENLSSKCKLNAPPLKIGIQDLKNLFSEPW